MRMRATAWIAAGLLAVGLLAACGNDDEPTTTEPASEQTTPDEAMGTAAVQTADSDLGTILVDPDGNTVYLFEADTDGESTCYDECEDAWPPLEAEGTPAAGDGADESLLGTTERTDGTMQVTYGGQPLYYFAADKAAGDTNGQGVGDVWFVVAPDGSAVKEKVAGGGYSRTGD